jgi:branched-chain amino acid transport system permease protein
LGQASFVGISALVTGLAVRGLHLGFPLTMVVGALAAAFAATLLGIVALRVRGLYLAVATLIFAWMCDQFLFRTPWMGASGGNSVIPSERLGRPGGIPYLDLTDQRTLFYVFLAIVVVCFFTLSNLRDTKVGRAFFAIRGSEMAAASLGIDVVRYKLVAFALSGVTAGIAGNLILMDHLSVEPSIFAFNISLQFVAIAVVGGLASLGGAVAAGAVFAALNEIFFRVSFLAGWLDIVSAGLLTVVLLAYPGGLAALPQTIRRFKERFGLSKDETRESTLDASVRVVLERAQTTAGLALKALGRGTVAAGKMFRPIMVAVRGRLSEKQTMVAPLGRTRDWFAKATGVEDAASTLVPIDVQPMPFANGKSTKTVLTLDPDAVATELPPREGRAVVLNAHGVVVRFGGLTAVNDASIQVREGEITGLIGPNGAGKTTLFNAILGLNDPVSGEIALFGQEMRGQPPHERARAGVARTFQVLQLFGELTVFENVLVATHLHNDSNLFSNLVATPKTLLAEDKARDRVMQVLRLLQLDSIADHGVRGLPFGTLRMVELARAMVTGAPLIMLDEPASGLNEAETDRLIHVVRSIRALGVSVLLIEHDVRMVTGICDYIYVLDQGRLIAEGAPSEIQRHPAVISAYLGEPAGAEASA